MMYICKNRGYHFSTADITVGIVYDIHKENSTLWFIDDEGYVRRLKDLLTDPYYGVWVRCDFSIYLGLLK